ncbi:hypothetical protein N9395_00405 [Pseudomonadales bacterium]|nr:hypothetical protein [Pseudomonadales bacterium]
MMDLYDLKDSKSLVGSGFASATRKLLNNARIEMGLYLGTRLRPSPTF